MNFLSLVNFKGVYTSLPFTIPLSADGVISKVSWEIDAPQNNLIVVQTRYSINGYDWSEWMNCINGSQIPELDTSIYVNNMEIMYRVIIQRDSYEINPVFKSITFEFEPILVFDNKGDSLCQPEIWITKIGNGDFSLINTSDRNEEFAFTELINNETVYVNNENGHIETDLATVYRFSNFNDNYLNLPVGKNVFKVDGHAKIQFRYQFKLI